MPVPNNKVFEGSPVKELLSQAKNPVPLAVVLNTSKHNKHLKILFDFPATASPIWPAACYQLQGSLVSSGDRRTAPAA